MQIKRFEATNMAEALSLIKQEFGPDAVILSARTLKKHSSMFGYLKKPIVEVTAAMDSCNANIDIKSPYFKPDVFHKNTSRHAEHKAPRSKMGLYVQSRGKQHNLIYNDSSPTRRRFDNHSSAIDFDALKQLMVQQGIQTDLVIDWLRHLKNFHLTPNLSNQTTLTKCLVKVLNEISKTVCPSMINLKKRNIIAFVGTTGVGKTTTIAKLAAMHALKLQKKVALVTLDNYRIAAIDQIKAYAKLIGIPMEVASNKKELITSLKKLENRNFILIDTPGISHMNKSRINHLKAFFNGMSHIQIQLLISISTNTATVDDILKNFKILPITGLIFTKLDETTTFGNIVNHLCTSNIPISYFTNGQEIPEDIDIATVDKIVNLVIGKSQVDSVLPVSPRIFKQEETLPDNRIKIFYVANRNSDVFHKPNCKAARKLKPSNMIVFEREADAISNGFKPCMLCSSYNFEEYEKIYSGPIQRKSLIN